MLLNQVFYRNPKKYPKIMMVFCTSLLISIHQFLQYDIDSRSPNFHHNFTNQQLLLKVSPKSTLIIYKAFLDQRGMKPAIRILVFSECRNIFARIQVDNKNYAGVAVPIEGKCPWQWAKACQWNSFLLTAKLLEQPSKDFVRSL